MAIRLSFNTLLLMLYLYFRPIYLFHVIPSLSLSSRSFTDPEQIECLKIYKISDQVMNFSMSAMDELYSGSGNRNSDLIRGTNLKNRPQYKLILATTISYNNSATKIRTWKVQKGLQIYNIKREDLTPQSTCIIQRNLQKMIKS